MTLMLSELPKEVFNFLLISITSIVMLFLANFSFEYLLYYAIRSVLTLSLILFISGYSFIIYVFNKEFETVEVLVMSVCMSICITVIAGMIVHLMGLEITFANIMNIVSVTTLILGLLGYFRVFSRKNRVEV